jgi:hypothetical protein
LFFNNSSFSFLHLKMKMTFWMGDFKWEKFLFFGFWIY